MCEFCADDAAYDQRGEELHERTILGRDFRDDGPADDPDAGLCGNCMYPVGKDGLCEPCLNSGGQW